MLDTLKEIILDYQEFVTDADTGVPRDLTIEPQPGKASVCIGVRRSGKSTLMLQRIKELLRGGVSRENILHINFFDDRLRSLASPALVLEAYFGLYPEKKNTETVYCFFDEIQTLDGWEGFVDRVTRMEKCEVYVTGSSARMLSKEIGTQMRGRSLSWELFPFSFAEYLDYKKIRTGKGALSSKTRLLIQKAFEEYRECGGFPEVLGLLGDDARIRLKIHQEYYGALLFRDIADRYDVSHPRALVDLSHRLADSIASSYSLNALCNYLKSLGHKISKQNVGEYLAWMEDAYFLFSVRLYDASLSRSLVNPRKIYCVDHALARSVSSGILANSGRLLENIVFVDLRRRSNEVFYYRTANGREVDFVFKSEPHGRALTLIQVCESLADPETRKREFAALDEAMSELDVNRGFVVTRSEEESIESRSGTITVVPAWKFLLA